MCSILVDRGSQDVARCAIKMCYQTIGRSDRQTDIMACYQKENMAMSQSGLVTCYQTMGCHKVAFLTLAAMSEWICGMLSHYKTESHQFTRTHQGDAACKDDEQDEVFKGLVFCELVHCGAHLHPAHHVW